MGKNINDEYKQDLDIFLTEVSELLESIEESLVELEKTPSEMRLIQEVFRAMHTIKGGAGMMGLQEGVEVTHVMESILDEVRTGRRALTTQMVDGIFLVLDWLKDWKQALEEGQPVTDPGEVLKKTSVFELETTSQEPTGSGENSDFIELVDLAAQEGRLVYEITINFIPETPLLSVRCFQAITLIDEASDVLQSIPSLEQVEKDECGDTLVLYVSCDDECREAEKIARSIQDVKEVHLRKVDSVIAASQEKEKEETETQKDDKSGKAAVRAPKRTALGRTVRVDVSLLDLLMNMVGELVIDRTRLSQIATRLSRVRDTRDVGTEIGALANHLQRTSAELQEGIMRARLLPVKNIMTKFPRMVRDLAMRCDKEVNLVISGEDTELDRTVLEAIDDPLIHIIRNALDHGIESPQERGKKGKDLKGTIKITARHEENHVLVEVEDDGAGINLDKLKKAAVEKGLLSESEVQEMSDREAVEIIFIPGFSTSKIATEVSGRGVGMDVVKSNLERVNGKVEIRTEPGKGTVFTLRLPLTLAIMRALLVRCNHNIYAIPTTSVEEVIRIKDYSLNTIQGKTTLTVRGKVFPLMSLASALNGDMWEPSDSVVYALLSGRNDEPLALGVDQLLGEEEVVVKEMGRLLSRLKGLSGVTILAHGDPAVILDVTRII